jgi:hypothetical protein
MNYGGGQIMEEEMGMICGTHEQYWKRIILQNFDRKIWREDTTRET